MTIKMGKGYAEDAKFVLRNLETGYTAIVDIDDVPVYLEEQPEDFDLSNIKLSVFNEPIKDIVINRKNPLIEVSMFDTDYELEHEVYVVRDAKTNRVISEWDYESDALEEIAGLISEGQYPDEEAIRLTRSVVYTCCYETEKTQQFYIELPDIPKPEVKELTYHEINEEIARLVELRAKISLKEGTITEL